MAENSEKSFPFDADPLPGSGLPDRSYLAEDWARYFRAFISSGTFLTEPTNLQVITNGDMTVTLKIGSMIIDGYRYDNVEDIIIPVEPADGVLNRIDRVAITWSATDRDIHYTLQKGNMSYDPVAPECRRSEEYKDYVVADIMVNAGIINISQTNIIDQRFNSEVCGLAVPFVEINTKNIFLQLQAFYDETVKNNALWQQEEKDKINAWFNNIKNQLSGDAAVNLQNQIGTLSSLTTNNKDNLVNAINELNEKKINASAILKTEEQVQANTNPDNVASAVVVGEVINNLGGYSFGETADGKPGYRKPGADTVIPFSKAAGTLSFRIKQSSGYAKPSGDNYPRAMVSGNYTVTINLETLTASISGSASVRCDDYIGTTNTVISGTANISTGISNIVINN